MKRGEWSVSPQSFGVCTPYSVCASIMCVRGWAYSDAKTDACGDLPTHCNALCEWKILTGQFSGGGESTPDTTRYAGAPAKPTGT